MSGSGYKDRSILIRAIGCIMLCAGAFLVVLGPLEIICFPMFWTGGRFHYEGFGFGSFMFGVIAAQIIAYPAAGALLLLLGRSHIRLKRWGRKLSLSLLWAWLAAGTPIMAAAAIIAAGTKDLTPASAAFSAALLVLVWPLIPILLIRFYGGNNAVKTFESRDEKTYWTDRLSMPALTLCALCALCMLMLIICVFFGGLFPLFGFILTSLQGFAAICACCALFALLIWGLLRRQQWAWYGAAAFLSLLLVSTIITYSLHSYQDILAVLPFAKTETEALAKLPLQRIHIALIMSFPYAGGVIAAAMSRKYLKH